MPPYVDRAGLSVDRRLAAFIEDEALPGSGVGADAFWDGMADLLGRFAPENSGLLRERDRLQRAIDDWERARLGQRRDHAAYQAFLQQIGYLQSEPPAFEADPGPVDNELLTPGPQLVAPALNARFLLNAANARWGSLYDALYGTDALGDLPPGAGYDPERGARVVARAKAFLDEAVPLAEGSWAQLSDPHRGIAIRDPAQYVGRSDRSRLFRHHGLHVEVVFGHDHPIGRSDPAHICDVVLESALTTIVDLEDSVAAVDAEDKAAGYRNWLGLMQGRLSAAFEKGGRTVNRELAADRTFTAPDGSAFTLPGRSLLLVRNVGLLMPTPAVRLPDGHEAPEGLIDAAVTALIALHDLKGSGPLRNSRAGSIYVVKPKLHGPGEAAFTDSVFAAVERMLGLPHRTIKVGLMDEERRTSANLAASMCALKERLVFVNTGFLDRTGDEIHTSMQAGPVMRKGEIKGSTWLKAYEARNVAVALACGLDRRGQIGKGMWAAPDRMAGMLAEKAAQLQAGASTAWVPSPTAATLHALHYHQVEVRARQQALAHVEAPRLEALLTPPLGDPASLDAEAIRREIENNCQGILGYVVRWIDQGVGCSKVPDIEDVGLMEDRATLRISAQHLANWLLHGVCTIEEVDAALSRMAAKVDAQNAGDPMYRPMAPHLDESLAFQAARALIVEGAAQPNGYTEPLLHAFRARAKAAAGAVRNVA